MEGAMAIEDAVVLGFIIAVFLAFAATLGWLSHR
jgi:hypothetical protein